MITYFDTAHNGYSIRGTVNLPLHGFVTLP